MDKKKAPPDTDTASQQAASIPAPATEATELLAKPKPNLAEAMQQLERELASQRKSTTGAKKLQ